VERAGSIVPCGAVFEEVLRRAMTRIAGRTRHRGVLK
jgi:hypothetical protein